MRSVSGGHKSREPKVRREPKVGLNARVIKIPGIKQPPPCKIIDVWEGYVTLYDEKTKYWVSVSRDYITVEPE